MPSDHRDSSPEQGASGRSKSHPGPARSRRSQENSRERAATPKRAESDDREMQERFGRLMTAIESMETRVARVVRVEKKAKKSGPPLKKRRSSTKKAHVISGKQKLNIWG